MKVNQQRPPSQWPMIFLFIVFSFFILISGHLFYKYQKNALIQEKQRELSTICDLKIGQISQWRIERLGDGQFLSENRLMAVKFIDFLRKPTDNSLRADILLSLSSLTNNFDFTTILILDTEGNTRLSFPEQDTLTGGHLKPLLPGFIKQHKIILTDVHRSDSTDNPHLDLIVPLTDVTVNDTLILGLLALRIDPEKVLYPLIQSWPTPSKSAESLLIRKEGNEVVYINELRHLKNPGLSLRKPVTDKKLPAVMAVQGITGSVDAEDYRGVKVIAAMRKVPGTPWYMVSKIDRDEIFAALNKEMTMVIIIIALIIASLGLLLSFIIRNQRVKFYRKQYENELDRLALVKHFDYILKFANDIILLIDSNLKIIEANDRALEAYMYSRDELIGMRLEKIRAPETISHLHEQLRNIIDNESATFETIHKRKDNTVFPVEISSRVVYIEGIRYFQTIGRDITERKHSEDILKESEEKFRKIFDESPFPMAMTGKDFIIMRANSAFINMIGYKESELKYLTFRDITMPEYIKNDEISLMRLINQELPNYHTEKRYVRKDGTVIWGSTTVSIIRNNKDEVQLFLAMVEDITSRKQTESELLAAKERAEESDKLKTAFLHNVSHEIRTPMNAIIGFSALLLDTELSEDERNQYGDIIFQSSMQLLSIINDIVDVANIESGQVRLKTSETNLNSNLRSLHDQFRFEPKYESINIILNPGLPDDESIIITDSTKLIQILSNLVNNALKFTNEGQVRFGYSLADNFLEFFVDDTGIGIPSEEIDKIFDRFYQVARVDSKKYAGTGLGLSICKAYVDLLGGKIWVTSQSGKGTSFRFTIPFIRP